MKKAIVLISILLIIPACAVKKCVDTDYGKICVELTTPDATIEDVNDKIDELLGD